MQPKNKPENLTPPHKGPSYCPKEKETKVIIEVLKSEEETKVKWHKYPEEKPQKESKYLVTMKLVTKGTKYIIINDYVIGKRKYFFNCDSSVIAWAELPEPYEEIKNV